MRITYYWGSKRYLTTGYVVGAIETCDGQLLFTSRGRKWLIPVANVVKIEAVNEIEK